ncbi:MAG: condensation domain-containing protein, partial [bacterium]
KLSKSLSYWENQLKNAPTYNNLPTDYQRKKKPSFKGKQFLYELSDELVYQIEKLIKKQNVTLFVFLISCLQILLSKYSRQKDIVIGFPIANRHYLGTEDLIGFFVNTLPLRVQLEDNLSFKVALILQLINRQCDSM